MKQRRKLSKPAPQAQNDRSRSRTSLEDNEHCLLPPQEDHALPYRPFRSQITPTHGTTASSTLFRNKSVPSGFYVLSTASSTESICEDSPAIIARVPSKLQKRQPPDDDDGDNGKPSGTAPTTSQTTIKEAHFVLGFGPREPSAFAVNDIVSSPPHALPLATIEASSLMSAHNRRHPLEPSWTEVQHPIKTVYLRPRQLLRGRTVPLFRRWKCCTCGVKTCYDAHVCSKLLCGHERCEGSCVTFESA
ncbi:hypothetical protein IWX49DRAFT_205100 [Phyllosticta citricarpa]|uniref:Uncharacterized protein n=2 Tax=Phyllosticta TaxID=121621 RepID=A0ABR1MHQ4_9PEZI